jgi:hypothetical protein
MTSEEKKAVFLDLYELYQEGELEEETDDLDERA